MPPATAQSSQATSENTNQPIPLSAPRTSPQQVKPQTPSTQTAPTSNSTASELDSKVNDTLLPKATLESTINKAIVEITTPQVPTRPVEAGIVFLVDGSTSMNDNDQPIEQVKTAVNEVVDDIHTLVNSKEGVNIEVAVAAFTNTTVSIIPPTRILSDKQSLKQTTNQDGKTSSELGNQIDAIKLTIDNLQANGSTEITQGLISALHYVKDMAERIQQGTKVFVVLTDGDQAITNSGHFGSFGMIEHFKDSLQSLGNVKFYAVGIGKSHNKETMRILASSSQKGFIGEYIDTTDGESTIKSAIAKAFKEIKTPSFQLSLTSSLKAGTWSAGRAYSETTPSERLSNTHSICRIGSAKKNTKLIRVLKINYKKLDDNLDLNLKFELHVVDPYGREGTITLEWDPDTIINTRVANYQPAVKNSSSHGNSGGSTAVVRRNAGDNGDRKRNG